MKSKSSPRGRIGPSTSQAFPAGGGQVRACLPLPLYREKSVQRVGVTEAGQVLGCVLGRHGATRRLRGWYVGMGSGRCLHRVGHVVEGAPKAVPKGCVADGDREGWWAVEHWIKDAETTFLDGDLGAESRIVGNGDFNDPRKALHERSLQPFAHKSERAIQRHRSGTIADLAPAETQEEQHEGGGQGTVSGRFEA